MAVAAVTLFLGICESGGDDATSEERALHLAAIFAGDSPSDIPFTDEYFDCIINVKRQPDPPASPLRNVAGKCLWTVEPQGSGWKVTFRETWLCSDWAADAAGYPPCESISGFHEWQYFVDLNSGTVSLLDDTGQFAPDM